MKEITCERCPAFISCDCTAWGKHSAPEAWASVEDLVARWGFTEEEVRRVDAASRRLCGGVTAVILGGVTYYSLCQAGQLCGKDFKTTQG